MKPRLKRLSFRAAEWICCIQLDEGYHYDRTDIIDACERHYNVMSLPLLQLLSLVFAYR